MRALLCRELGAVELLRLETIDDPLPGSGDVVVDVHAAGLNFPDTLIIAGKYQLQPEMPFVPGAEAAGTISAVGEDVSDWRVGDRVIVSGAFGAFAEKVLKKSNEIVALPDTMDFATGAGFLAAYGTSYYALKQRAALSRGETLLVLGAAGGVGLAAVDIGSALGARVIAAASSDEKLNIARQAGANDCINYKTENLKERVKELTEGRGADVVYDPVGGDLSEQALRATGWGGRFLVIGFAAGDIARIPLNLCLLKNNSIVGVFYGAWIAREPAANAENLAELFAMYEKGELSPLVTQVFRIEDYTEAFSTLTGRRAQGKIIFKIRD
jgi:NADPH2:quinone reductase